MTKSMKKHLHLLCTALLALTLAACGTDSKHFQMEGRLLNVNQAEFYVYRLQGGNRDVDTIKVQAGRFSYTTECSQPTTLMVIFPNFTEQPIFAEPGKSVDIKGDASHLKEMTVKGTKANELMNAFRDQIKSASPPEVLKYAQTFVEDHPESVVSAYLVRRYFIACNNPNIAIARNLLKRLRAAQPDDAWLARLEESLQGRSLLSVGEQLPHFKYSTTDGTLVSSAQLATAPTAVIVAYASWSPESCDMLRSLTRRLEETNGAFKVLGISLDATPADNRRCQKDNQISVPTICDGRMLEASLYNKLGMASVPDNIVLKNGRVVGKSLSYMELMKAVAPATHP